MQKGEQPMVKRKRKLADKAKTLVKKAMKSASSKVHAAADLNYNGTIDSTMRKSLPLGPDAMPLRLVKEHRSLPSRRCARIVAKMPPPVPRSVPPWHFLSLLSVLWRGPQSAPASAL